MALTETGYSALLAASERPSVPIVAITPNLKVYHCLNLVWGVRPILHDYETTSLENLLKEMETILKKRNFVSSGDQILVLGGLPIRESRSTNFLNIHTIS